jgi:ribonuclease P protein component
LGHCRLGVTVTRKIGGAVLRNRVKRVLRDVFRRHRGELVPALDLVVNARPGIEATRSNSLETEFLACFAELSRRFKA